MFKKYFIAILLLLGLVQLDSWARGSDPGVDYEGISSRYYELLVGHHPDYSNPVLNAAWETLLASVEEAHADAERILSRPSKGSYAIAGMPKAAQNELRDIFDILPLLAMGYQVEGIDSPYYQNAETFEVAVDLLNLLYEKGFKPGFELGIDVAEARNDMESLGFFGFGGTLYNQLDGYPVALFLLRNELKQANLFDRELQTLEWVNQLFIPDASNKVPGAKFPGYNSDGFRKLTRLYFPFVLLLENDDPNKVRYFEHYRKMLAKGLGVATGFADTFKPDGLGYHHKGVYIGAYSPSTFIDAALMAWLLNDTSYAYTETELETVLNAYRTMRIISGKYDTVQGIAGRFPSISSPILEMLPGYALLGTPESDAMFSRLWNPEHLVERADLLKRAPRKGIGVFQKMVELGSRNIAPEKEPEGFWTFPYGGLAIHRRDGWMACVKGQSKYVWNYESSKTQNLYGYHGSSAALSIFAGASEPSRSSSGYAQPGWDWEHIPGVTAPVLGLDKNKSAERQLTASSFMGGVDLDNRNGVFAAHHQFIPGKKAYKSNGGCYPSGEGWLEARKSYFFFDDVIVALGSGISARKDAGDVHTTLFQTAVNESPRKTKNKSLLSDGVGNFYYVPNTAKLRTKSGEQESKTDRKKPSAGFHTKAWFDHGNKPRNDGYEYVVLVQMALEDAKRFANNPDYQVLRKDNRAHIVQHPTAQLIGYALFEAGKVGDTIVAEVDTPCLVMVGKADEGLKISVCNPDFGRVPLDQSISLTEAKALPLLYAESTPQPVRITLHGKWQPEAGSKVQIVSRSDNATTLEFPCIDAMCVQTYLQRSDL